MLELARIYIYICNTYLYYNHTVGIQRSRMIHLMPRTGQRWALHGGRGAREYRNITHGWRIPRARSKQEGSRNGFRAPIPPFGYCTRTEARKPLLEGHVRLRKEKSSAKNLMALIALASNCATSTSLSYSLNLFWMICITQCPYYLSAA